MASKNFSSFLILIFVGIAFSIGLFSFIAFFFNQRTEFLFYTLYLFTLIFYLGKLPLLWEGFLEDLNFQLTSRVDTMLQIAANIFYYLFIRSFLNLKQELPMANKLVNITVAILGVLFLSEFVLNFVGDGNLTGVSLTQRMILVSCLFLILVAMILTKLRTVLVYIILIGSSILMLGSLLFSLYTNVNYLVLGLILEILIFALAILYKIKLINDERDRVRVEALESKNRALRAQINPHFIFNALASIQNLVNKDDKKASLEYLSKFGRLTRNILDGSMNTHVLLEEEIKMTKDYLELESLRFSERFEYSIEIDENIDPAGIEVPMLFMQPFVENAIIHGLLLKEEGERLLKIKFEKKEGFLVCTVEDNGIGREQSAKMKSTSYKKKSHGIEVTSQRFGHNDSVEIIDLKNDEGKPKGTKVILKVPLTMD
ncbi:MAG: sensor histidine kinase [Flagellimonas sp.]